MTSTPRLGLLPISTDLFEQILQLPEGYKIVACHYNEWGRTVNFTLMSDTLPEVQEGQELPRLVLLASVSYLENVPREYRKITTEIKQI